MRQLLALAIFLGLSITADAQPVLECPPGPFDCVPWGGGGGDPAPPPPPFFEVQPKFIHSESFQGYVARGDGSTLQISEEAVPDAIRDAVESYRDRMDPAKLYLFLIMEFKQAMGLDT